jgi:hypothetical protein
VYTEVLKLVVSSIKFGPWYWPPYCGFCLFHAELESNFVLLDVDPGFPFVQAGGILHATFAYFLHFVQVGTVQMHARYKFPSLHARRI